MNLDIAGEVERVASEVLECFAFVFADAAQSNEEPPPQDALCAEVSFNGAAQGKLTILASLETAQEIAASALGIDEEAAVSAAPDTLKELANQICGQMLTALAGKHALIELGIPDYSEAAASKWEAIAARDGAVCLLIDGMSPLLVQLDFVSNGAES